MCAFLEVCIHGCEYITFDPIMIFVKLPPFMLLPISSIRIFKVNHLPHFELIYDLKTRPVSMDRGTHSSSSVATAVRVYKQSDYHIFK